MLLVIDVGNTQTVVGVYDGTELKHHFRLSSDRHRTEDELGVLLSHMLLDAGTAPSDLTAAVVACVVPPMQRTVTRMCRMRLGIEPIVVGPGVRTGMPILYESPREVGADRIVNGVAGYERFHHDEGGPWGVIVVDFGTATTFDVVSPQGEYMGGAIAPGVYTATEALFERASKLPRIDLQLPDSCIGRNTVESMQAGILFGYIGLVEGMVQRMRGELEFSPRVLATGGIASVISAHTDSIEIVDDLLTLRGLQLIYHRNSGD